VYWVQSNGH